MKLITPNGELDLPRDFSLTMERNNPILSGDGDSSIPATLPSSTKNLAALGHRERIDRAEKYGNKVEAILQIGPIQKHGNLVMDTVHRRDGIDASFAIDNSDLYSKSKNKTLKEIFHDYTETFTDIDEACTVMEKIYQDGNPSGDYVVFPVAVASYEDNGETIYQYNNKIVSDNLVWRANDPNMVVHEGDTLMTVPNGYSVAPFLKLHRLVSLLFTILEYEVTENCLSEWPFDKMVIVHNCSDCLCNPTATLYYRDLVPSCTLSEFLEWLNNKFHVQPVVDSESKRVRIVAMESILDMAADIDITPILEGDFTVQLNPSKRIILTPTNTIEGTKPAADTFDKLIEKYSGFVYVNEAELWTLETLSPAVQGGLVLRRSTGQFYALEFDANQQHQVIKPLGTNHFTYDRNNSEDVEDFGQSDSIPLMLCGLVKPGQTTDTLPFIGDRQHAHTSYENSTADDKQDIIVVQAVTDEHLFYLTTGTTQPFIPYKQPEGDKHFLQLGLGTTPYDLYEACWKKYNTLLLNHPTNLEGKVLYSVGQILGMDLTRIKFCNGQRLLPVSSSSTIGTRPKPTEAKFMLVKSFVDGVEDEAILPQESGDYIWEVTDDADDVAEALWISMGGTAGFGEIDVPDTNWGVESHYLQYTGYHVTYVGEALYPGTPHQGDVVILTRMAVFTIYYLEIIENEPEVSPQYQSFECQSVFEGQTVTFTFTAVHV